VLLTAVRKGISGAEEPPISEIMDTNILQIISQIFRFNDTSEEIRIMKVSIGNNS
jgi:hypothetical protein